MSANIEAERETCDECALIAALLSQVRDPELLRAVRESEQGHLAEFPDHASAPTATETEDKA